MSSPHVGGDFIHMFAAKGVNINNNNSSGGAGGRPGSGRSTPTMGVSPARSIHRSIPAQLANPRGRPQLIAGSIGGRPVGADSDDEDEVDANRAGGVGWRPITPSRAGANSSPRAASSVPQGHNAVLNPRAFPPSSRANAEEDGGLQMHHTGRLPAIDPDGQLLADCYNEDGTAATSDVTEGAPEEKPVRFADLPPVLKGYLLGQIACVVKFGVWWVGFTYLILALFGGSGYLVGGTRICFNGALLICSPMAGGIAERTNIKKLLNKTVLFRGIIYVLAIPLAWVLMESGLLWSEHTPLHIAFFVVFLLIIFLDGIGVSFSNVADIDSGGVNLVAAQYGIEIDDNIRNYFNSLHIMFFDLSMVIFNPLLAYIGLLVGQHAVTGNDSVKNVVDEMTLLIAIGGVFFVSTLVTLICYNVYMPDLGDAAKTAAPLADGVQPMGSFDPNTNLSVNGGGLDQSFGAPDPAVASGAVATAEPEPFSWAAFKELASSVREGGALTWANTRIRYRVLFFAVETSVEDAMIALIAAEIGSEVFAASGSEDDDLHYAYGNLWGAGLVAVGKSGGVLASMLMHRLFRVDEVAESLNPGKAYKPLFWFAFLGGLCSLLLPVSYWMRRHQILDSVYTTSIMFIAMFLFFLFSTLSKIGFSTLMQSMAAEVEATGRVFGFVAAFVTATDALILMGMAAIFSSLDLQLALWIATAFIAVHGLVELVFGPSLVLKPSAKSLDDQFAQDLAQPLM